MSAVTIRNRTMKRCIEDAAKARSDLNIFYGVIAILEGGTLSVDSDTDAQRIIEICKRASHRSLHRMDSSIQLALEIGGRCAPKADPRAIAAHKGE